MSICSYSKSTKSTPTSTSTSSTRKKTKDERCYSNNLAKLSSRKLYPESKRRSTDFGINWDNNKGKPHKGVQKYAPGISCLKGDGNVKESCKKVSLNHLLNFKFEPRESESKSGHSRTNFRTGYKRNSCVTSFSKERFLQANCQFVVTQYGDYTKHYIDPDMPLPWDKVEQVNVKVENELCCSICLYPPSAAKITKCGHIYCWPCILCYLALADGAHRGCPICNVDVHRDDLRSVTIYEQIPLCIGSKVKMTLMFRHANSLTPYPSKNPYSVEDGACRNVKISCYSHNQVLDTIVEPELKELNIKLTENLEDMERLFVSTAIEECKKRKSKVLTMISKMPSYRQDSEVSQKNSSTDAVQNSPRAQAKGGAVMKSSEGYHFYQIEDGSYVYLNGINIKCLMKEYGGLTKCPATIEANLVSCGTFIMTEGLRKRHKYLSHLPLSCEYRIAELDLQPPLVSQKVLIEFQDQIQRKAIIRERKESEENESRRRAEIQEQQKLTNQLWSQSYIGTNHVIDTDSMGSVSVFFAVTNKTKEEKICGSDHDTSPENHHGSTTKSFAEMLKSSEVVTPKPRRPVSHLTPASPGIETMKIEDSDAADPYYIPPAYQLSFGDALSSALNSLDVSTDAIEVPIDSASTPSHRQNKKKHKQRKKQTLLFSTSAGMHNL